MNKATEIFFALGMDKTNKLRKAAAYVVGRYVYEFNTFGCCSEGGSYASFKRICKRFKLGDWAMALMAHYPIRFV